MGIVYVSTSLAFLVGILGLILYSRIQSSLRMLILVAFASGMMEVLGAMTSRHGANNQMYFNVYLLVEFSFMLFALKDLLGPNFRRIALAEYGVLTMLYIAEAYHNGMTFLMQYTLITSLAMLAINNLIAIFRTVSVPDSQSAGIYFITVSALLYYCSVIPQLGLYNTLIGIKPELFDVVYTINMVADIVRFLGIAAGFIYIARLSHTRGKTGLPAAKRSRGYGR